MILLGQRALEDSIRMHCTLVSGSEQRPQAVVCKLPSGHLVRTFSYYYVALKRFPYQSSNPHSILRFYWQSTVPSVLFLLHLLAACSTVHAARWSSCVTGRKCAKYECNKGYDGSRDYKKRNFTTTTQSVFTRACKCEDDWNDHFCKNMTQRTLYTVNSVNNLPAVCICRKFSDAGDNCQQFMTQCYSDRPPDDKCSCCFNQPVKYCNQLQCTNREPDFGMKSNTTCACFEPADYPYFICSDKNRYSTAGDTRLFEMARRGDVERTEKKIQLLGMEITPTILFVVVLSLLGSVIILTGMLLVIRCCRLRRQRNERRIRRNNAQSALLQQRVEEEKYLP